MAKPSLSCFSILFLLFFLAYAFDPEKPTDRRILIILDDVSLKSSHSIFFNSLQSRGYILDFKLCDDKKIALQRYGHYLYDGLILFSPFAESIGDGSLDLKDVLDFIDSGHDLIVAANANASDFIRNVASECGVDFEDDTSAMVIGVCSGCCLRGGCVKKEVCVCVILLVDRSLLLEEVKESSLLSLFPCCWNVTKRVIAGAWLSLTRSRGMKEVWFWAYVVEEMLKGGYVWLSDVRTKE